MDHADEFRRCLIEIDVAGIRRLWAHVQPGQPFDDERALIALHMARTQAETLTVRQRAWSHCWLRERDLPSQLPDHLKAGAERIYPKVVDAVGISVNFSAVDLRPAAALIERAMSDAVADVYADGGRHVDLVRKRMREAGQRERRKLFGREGG